MWSHKITIAAALGLSMLPACEPEEPSLSPSWEEFVAHPPMTWAEYLAAATPAPDSPDRYVIEGDVVVAGQEALRARYHEWLGREYAARTSGTSALQVVWGLGGYAIWQSPTTRNLTYCVSDAFGSYKRAVVAGLNRAALSWSARLPVVFRYLPEHDAACTSANTQVVFRVVQRSDSAAGNLSFYPDAAPQDRELRVSTSWLVTPTPSGFDRALRHDVGHILGFGHDPTGCSDSMERSGNTLIADPSSIMQLPCGQPSLSAIQTETDYRAAAMVYGAAGGRTLPAESQFFIDGAAGAPAYWETIDYVDLDGNGTTEVCGLTSLGIYCRLPTYPLMAASWSQTAPSQWKTLRFVDVTGDGRADACGRAADGIWCAAAVGAGVTYFASPIRFTTAFDDATGWGNDEHRWRTITFVDVNGDGRADVCGRAAGGIQCALSAGSSFGPARLWTTEFGDSAGWQYYRSYWETIQFPDVNGDGRADVCGRGHWGLFCAVSDGASFVSAKSWTSQYSNADGWAGSESYWSTIQFADLDGDGKDDVCGRGTAALHCALSDGGKFLPTSFWSPGYSDLYGWEASRHWATLVLTDIDNDGKADACGRSEHGFLCARSTGTRFADPEILAEAFADRYGFTEPSMWGTVKVADTNGDGRAEVCGRTPQGVVCTVP